MVATKIFNDLKVGGAVIAEGFTGNVTGNVSGSSGSCTGNAATATTASKLSSNAGSSTQPIYFENGVPKATTYALNKTVPSNALFTDTQYSAASGGGLSLSGTEFSVKTGYTTSGKNYAVTKDSSGNLYVNVPWTDNNTTYESKSAVSGGTEVSLVTTGEKYTWNSKANTTSPEFSGTPKAPTASTGTNSTQIATTAFVRAEVDSRLAANDAMLFKGTIGTGGTVTALPATHNAGWTYKVITAGTYTGKVCEVGDMIMCITDGTTASDAHWTVVQTNIDGAVTGPASSTDAHIAVFNGATGKIIKDSGFTIATSVPSGAKFTDTTYSAASGGGLELSGTAFSVKTGYTTTDKNYAVQKDSNGNLYVNVPWTDHTYTVNNGTLAIQGSGTTASSFTANNSGNVTLNIKGSGATTVTKTADNEITVSSTDNDTKNTAGTTASTGTKLFLVGAASQAANPQTYSNANCYVGTDNCLYSGGTKVLTAHQSLTDYVTKTGSESMSNKTITGSTYNGYNLGAACSKGVAASIASGGTDLATSGQVYSASHMNTATVTVPAAGGAVTVSGMTASAIVWVSPAPASFSDYTTAGCYCSAQAANSLTFNVAKTAAAAMSVNVVWREP